MMSSAFGMLCSMMKELTVGMITSLLPFTTSVGCLIVFIASDEASFITGHVLNVDGGRTAG